MIASLYIIGYNNVDSQTVETLFPQKQTFDPRVAHATTNLSASVRSENTLKTAISNS